MKFDKILSIFPFFFYPFFVNSYFSPCYNLISFLFYTAFSIWFYRTTREILPIRHPLDGYIFVFFGFALSFAFPIVILIILLNKFVEKFYGKTIVEIFFQAEINQNTRGSL